MLKGHRHLLRSSGVGIIRELREETGKEVVLIDGSRLEEETQLERARKFMLQSDTVIVLTSIDAVSGESVKILERLKPDMPQSSELVTIRYY